MSDNDLSRAAKDLAEAASDYILALRDAEFAQLNGGINALLDAMVEAERKWIAAYPEGDCRDLP